MSDVLSGFGASAEGAHSEVDRSDSRSLLAGIECISEEKAELARKSIASKPRYSLSKLIGRLKYGRMNKCFDPVWYLGMYDDVREGAHDPWVHYSRFGLKEGRQPNPYFAPAWYIANNPDVAATRMNPLQHYMRFGAAEGRDPHPLFSTTGYLARNPDVVALGINPLFHFLRFGISEGRLPVSVEEAKSVDAPQADPPEEPATTVLDEYEYEYEDAFRFDGFLPPFALPGFDLARMDIRTVPRLPARLPPVAIVLSSTGEDASARSLRFLNCFIRPCDKIFVLREKPVSSTGDDRVVETTSEAFCRPGFCEAVGFDEGYLVFISDEQKIDFSILLRLLQRMAASGRKFGYGDECYCDGGHAGPFFKPDWDPALLLHQDYIGRAAVVDIGEASWLGWFESAWAPHFADRFALRNFERLTEEHVEHIQEILAISPFEHTNGVLPDRVVRRTLISRSSTVREFARLMRNPPRTEIIIPTRDGYNILKTCIDSITVRTRFRGAFSITIVNNQSQDPQTLAYLDECKGQGIKVIDFDEPFNYSRMNNVAAAGSDAECLVFLNNDIEVITAGWLQRMVAAASLSDVGAVGAKLLYPDNRVQHGGVVLGPGHSAMHVLRLSGRDDPGYAWQLTKSRSYLAVTAACLAVSRTKFLEVGGFDEVNLPVAYNDVDFCLKLYMNGYSNLWLPGVKLFHHESISRGADTTPEKRRRAEAELRYMWQTWSALYVADPFHNSNILYSWGPNVVVRAA